MFISENAKTLTFDKDIVQLYQKKEADNKFLFLTYTPETDFEKENLKVYIRSCWDFVLN